MAEPYGGIRTIMRGVGVGTIIIHGFDYLEPYPGKVKTSTQHVSMPRRGHNGNVHAAFYPTGMDVCWMLFGNPPPDQSSTHTNINDATAWGSELFKSKSTKLLK